MVIRTLLEIFVRSSSPGVEITLNCEECFIVMEYFVDLALDGLSLDKVKTPLLRHINHCPDCQEHHLQRLTEMEAWWRQIQQAE